MTIHTFSSRRHRFASALSVLLALLMLLPSLAVFARPAQSAAAAPSGDPVDRLKVGEVIWARNNATGKAEWKQVTHASKRTVSSLLKVELINARTGQPVEALTCPLDEAMRLNSGKHIPAARLAVGNSIVTRAGPVCRVTAMWLLKRPGGFVLSDVRVGPLSTAQAKRLALSQAAQARPLADASFARFSASASAGAGSNTLNSFLFQGQQFDPASGDYYLRARYYDPTMGRFLSQDPFAGLDTEPVSLHRYLYASDDPGNRVDPSGLEDMAELQTGLAVNGTLTPVGIGASGVGTVAAVGSAFAALAAAAESAGVATPLVFSTIGGVALRRAALIVAGGFLVSVIGSDFAGLPNPAGNPHDGINDGHQIVSWHYSIYSPEQFNGTGLKAPAYTTNDSELSPQAARAILLAGNKGPGPLQYRYTVVMSDSNPLYPIQFDSSSLGVGSAGPVYQYYLKNGSPPGSVTEVATYNYQTYLWEPQSFP